MSDESKQNDQKEEVDHASSKLTLTVSATTKISRSTTLDVEGKHEEGDDEGRKPPALDFHFEDHSSPTNFLPMPSDHEMSYVYPNPIHQSTSGTTPIFSPYVNRHFAIPSFGEYHNDHNFAEAFDMSTQVEGTFQVPSNNATTSAQERAVDLQGIALLRSSSNEIGEEGEAPHDSPGGPRFHSVVPRLSNTPSLSSDNAAFFQDPFLSSFDLQFTPQVYYPHDSYGASPHPGRHTPLQSTRHAGASRTAAAMPAKENEDEDSSLEQKTTPSPIKSIGNLKAKETKTLVKKRYDHTTKKRRFRPSRMFNGMSSSPSPGGANNQTYKHIGPNAQELAGAKTDRAKIALSSWYQRLQDLIEFRDRYGHTRVPQKYAKNRELGIWVNKQRMEKKNYDEGNPKSSMNPIKIAKLEAAGFVWAKPKGVDAWEQKLEELQEYLQEKGDPNVPTKYPNNRALGRWVSTQRNMYKKYHLDRRFNNLSRAEIERRISLLDALGFSWSMASTSDSDNANNNESHENDQHHG